MKRMLALLGVSLLACAGGSGTRRPPPRESLPPRLNVFWPAWKLERLENGLTLLCNSDRRLPLVSVTIALPGGRAADPADRGGLSEVLVRVMTERTKQLGPRELNLAQDQIGSSITPRTDVDAVSFAVEVLPDRVLPALSLLAEVVRNPAFSQQDVNNAKAIVDQERLEAWGEPQSAADLVLARAVFGATHPLGVPPHGTAKSLTAITLGDVVQAIRQRARPDAAVLAVAGAVECGEVQGMVGRLYATWTPPDPAAHPPAMPPIPPPPARRSAFMVPRPGLTQTYIELGRLGLPRGKSESYMLRHTFSIVASRASQWMREYEGASYGFGSRSWATRDTSLVAMTGSVEAKHTQAALDSMFGAVGEIGNLAVDVYLYGVIATEAFNMVPFSGRVREVSLLVAAGLPPNFLEILARETDGLRRGEFHEVSRTYVKASDLQLVLVGDPTLIRSAYKSLDAFDFPRLVEADAD